MRREDILLFVIFFSIAFILIFKFLKIYLKKRHFIKIDAVVTDITKRTTYQKNIYIYYYEYYYKKEKYTTFDQTKYKILGFNPQIKNVYNIYINTKNPNECITPLALFLNKMSFLFNILLIIIPFLL